MKALFTCIFIAFFTAAAAWAQTPPQNAPKSERPSRIIGIRGGGNIANITGYDLAFGYHAGVFVDMLPGKSAGYGLEINYSRQGGTIENTSIVANYLVIPVLFNLYGSEVAFQVGPYAAPLLNARRKKSNYNYTDSMSGL
ncbi:MAG TPA: outer membrane beta-barrel protein, partial [Adhaeribacter sp.]|nr:outer membrane beta-barrel protein [Adhaeribacter sp.]